jgi:hypothetical protein
MFAVVLVGYMVSASSALAQSQARGFSKAADLSSSLEGTSRLVGPSVV